MASNGCFQRLWAVKKAPDTTHYSGEALDLVGTRECLYLATGIVLYAVLDWAEGD